MTENSRRFTDREVAMVLHKASEIDEAQGDGSGSGLSLDDLTEIAKEVGISSAAIHRAVAGLDRRRPVSPTLAGAPLIRKAVHAIPGELNEQAIARLVRLVDERADGAGTISEALGSVRWTSSDRFKSTRISITPGGGETSIEVVEKVVPRMRRIMHLVPAAWASMFVGSFVAASQLPPGGSVAAAAIGLAVGVAVGRAAWNLFSAQSGRRVQRLAEELATEAHESSKKGLITASQDTPPAEDRDPT